MHIYKKYLLTAAVLFTQLVFAGGGAEWRLTLECRRAIEALDLPACEDGRLGNCAQSHGDYKTHEGGDKDALMKAVWIADEWLANRVLDRGNVRPDETVTVSQPCYGYGKSCPLAQALEIGHPRIARLLILRGAKPVHESHCEECREAPTCHCRMHGKDSPCNALRAAGRRCWPACTRLLLAAGMTRAQITAGLGAPMGMIGEQIDGYSIYGRPRLEIPVERMITFTQMLLDAGGDASEALVHARCRSQRAGDLLEKWIVGGQTNSAGEARKVVDTYRQVEELIEQRIERTRSKDHSAMSQEDEEQCCGCCLWPFCGGSRRRSQVAQRSDSCSICSEKFNAASSTLACGHRYHSACIFRWRDTNRANGCPLCRADMATGKPAAASGACPSSDGQDSGGYGKCLSTR